MISSIVLTGQHKIGMNSTKKIKVNDTILSIEKDIPFIRYRFNSYDISSVEYIKATMQQFNVSTHLVEIQLDINIVPTLQLISSNFSNVAKFVYIELTEDEVLAHQFNPEKIALLGSTLSFGIDRYMIKDKSTSLDPVTIKKLIKSLVDAYKIPEGNIGVCTSPLSFGGSACLTAVKAREIMSIYSPIADVSLPSANHECMNCCGCIRYMVVSSDLDAPSESKAPGAHKKEKNNSEKSGDTPSETTNKAKPKNIIIPGMYNL